MVVLKIVNKEDVKKYRGILRKELDLKVGLSKSKLKRPTIISVTAPKNQDYSFTEDQAKQLTSIFIRLNLVDCLGDSFSVEDFWKNRSQVSFSIPA